MHINIKDGKTAILLTVVERRTLLRAADTLDHLAKFSDDADTAQDVQHAAYLARESAKTPSLDTPQQRESLQ